MRRIALTSLGASVAFLGVAWLLVVWAIPAPTALLLFIALSCCIAWFAIGLWRHARRDGRRVVLGVFLAVVALPLAVVLGALSSAFVNNIRLAQFSTQLLHHPLPPGTRQIAASSEVGVLTGNGNHCDFIASLQLSSELPGEVLRAHYATLDLRPAIPGGAGGGLPRLDVSPTPGRGNGVYSVVATDAPYEGIFDVRCQ